MSSDFISGIGAKSPRLNQTGQFAPQRQVSAPTKAETGNTVAAQAPTEAFNPTAEAKETASETKAGAAKASAILGAWQPSQISTAPTAGHLAISGSSHTSIHQTHGVSNGSYTSSNGPQPGFTEGTVYNSRPPQL